MKKSLLLACAFGCLLVSAMPASGAGISVDTGLTPPEGRWILRTQFRTMTREMPGASPERSMRRNVIPLVLVHGLRSNLTVGVRQTYELRSMTMGDKTTDTSGLGDLYVFAKFKAVRINNRNSLLGISPTLAVEPPSGANSIGSGAWDLAAGLNLSGRLGTFGVDLDLRRRWEGFAGLDEGLADPGDEIGIDLAFSYQIPLGDSDRAALAPVLEINWMDVAADELDGNDLANTGEDILAIAPGLKYTLDDTILEGLVRIPVSQNQNGAMMEAGAMVLVGVRQMF